MFVYVVIINLCNNIIHSSKPTDTAEVKQLTTQLNEANQQIDKLQTSTGQASNGGGSSTIDLNETTIIRVCQRIKEEIIDDCDPNDPFGSGGGDAMDTNDSHEIWALIEYESPDTNNNNNDINPLNTPSFRRHKQWICFKTESALSDYIRRDTGEPLTLPPYSLSPDQSHQLEEETKKQVASISEEFRRFRVRAEVAKKQADATVRALHTNSVQTTRMRIEGQDIESELAQAKTDHVKLTALRSELAEQEARWKESYDLLLAENEKLKSSGAEALLAAQWRHRYEACLKEKEDAITNLNMEKEKNMEIQDQKKRVDAGKYEAKYRDLKVSCCMVCVYMIDCILISAPLMFYLFPLTGIIPIISTESKGDICGTTEWRNWLHAIIT